MASISVTKARADMKNIINRAVYAGEKTYLTSYDKTVAVVIPSKEFEYLEKLREKMEDEEDIRDAEIALSNYEKNGGISLEEMKKLLGD